MIEVEVEFGAAPELTADMVRAQLDRLVRDEVFRSSKRSVAFLKYVVEETLNARANQIKERTIGVEVFGRDPDYETNLDHIVRTAAAELRKRLATYYVDEKHRSELRMSLLPGSYIPRFTLPGQARTFVSDPGIEEVASNGEYEAHHVQTQLYPLPHPRGESDAKENGKLRRHRYWPWIFAAVVGVAVAVVSGDRFLHQPNPQDLFWKPVLDTPGPVLLVVGDHPNGPPTVPATNGSGSPPVPIASTDFSQTVPFADTVTVARIVGILEAQNKQVLIHRGEVISFSDLRQGAAVLIGAFNNEWSLRLTRHLRYSLAMDEEKHLIYIRDAKSPSSRTWSWGTNQPRVPATGANSPKIEDYALISRFENSETGHVVVVIGGLYTYGTEAAGEFFMHPDMMQAIAKEAGFPAATRNMQIVLRTTVTDGTPGPPTVLAVSTE